MEFAIHLMTFVCTLKLRKTMLVHNIIIIIWNVYFCILFIKYLLVENTKRVIQYFKKTVPRFITLLRYVKSRTAKKELQ